MLTVGLLPDNLPNKFTFLNHFISTLYYYTGNQSVRIILSFLLENRGKIFTLYSLYNI